MAVGYAIGTASDVESVVKKADSLMYENKALMKSRMVEFGSIL